VRLVERSLPVRGDAHVVALQAQRALEDVRDVTVVLDDEDPGRAVVISHETMVGQWRDGARDI